MNVKVIHTMIANGILRPLCIPLTWAAIQRTNDKIAGIVNHIR